MDQLLETIDLDAEKSNELFFKIRVEGLDQAPTKVRLVCEAGDVSYMFKGYSTNEEGMIQFMIPALKGQIKEGTYVGRVEVLIENRYFSPLTFNLNFKREMNVVVESVQPARRPNVGPSVTASVIPSVRKVVAPEPTPQPIAKQKPFVIETETRQPVKPAPTMPRSTSLKERHASKPVKPEIVDFDALDETLIENITRQFTKPRK